MALQTTTTQDIQTILGNGLSIYLDSGNNLRIKDSNGKSALLTDYLKSLNGINSVVAGTNISIDETDPKNPIISANIEASKKTYFFSFAISQNFALNTLWWCSAGNTSNIYADSEYSTIPMVIADAFAGFGVQSPCFVMPFDGYLKTLTWRGWTNTSLEVNIRVAIQVSDRPTGGAVNNPRIIADETVNLKNFSSSSAGGDFSPSNIDSAELLLRGSEIRLFLTNNGVTASNLFASTWTLEFEENI